jgi:hypothetical protein
VTPQAPWTGSGWRGYSYGGFGAGQIRWTTRWKPAINAFAITFGDRFPAAEAY